jgi:glycosyltransferase involved in cell wall biosynthesis
LTVHQLGFAAALAEWRAAGAARRAMPRAVFRHLRDLDFELRATLRAHLIVTMSADDARRLRRFLPGLPVEVSPCGVDLAHFSPHAVLPAPPTDLLFVGNFGHPPNRDAVVFLVREVLPRLAPTSLRIVGREITPEVSALAAAPGVEVVGAVDDVRPHLHAARAVVAPVRFGTGMRGKVLEALAMARPVIATPLGAEGLGAVDGRHLLLADGPGQWARTIATVLGSPDLARRLGEEGRALVLRSFDWDRIADAHDAIYARAIDAAPPRRDPFAGRAATWQRLAAAVPRPLSQRVLLATGALIAARRGMHWYSERLWR